MNKVSNAEKGEKGKEIPEIFPSFLISPFKSLFPFPAFKTPMGSRISSVAAVN